MSRYPAYPSYRDTSREWFPEIPTHWRDSKLRWLGTRFAGGTPDKNRNEYWEDGTIPWLNSGAVNQGTITEPSELITEDGFKNSSAKWIAVDSLVMALAGQGKTKGMVAQTKIRTTCNQSMAAIVINEDEPRFIYWWLCSQYKNIRGLTSDEGRDGLNLEIVGGIRCPLPPIEEQKVIARFLDFKTAQIDALIAKKKELLDKLAEKRTALISHAVTKGLDPTVATRDSGVAWLGDIPSHWKALPLRRLITTVKTGTTPSGVNEFHFDDDGISWFRPGDFSDQIFLQSAEKRLSEEGIAEVRVFPAFTVMHVGIGATIGKVGVTTEQSSCNQQINAVVCNERLHHLFAVYFLQAIKEYIVKCGKYTTLPIINQDETKSLFFTVPPIDEQVRIAEYLLREERIIEEQAKKISQVIVALQEYRSALITNAVTGKIDVRDVPIGQAPEA